ncbi:hypothetical protein GGR57DRAFT_484371 [Xylariaceae sp. FL1272]|nr:hypothetical protein GGR57DRAFT_484371 [Xylariaceae sp. FL1272]
MKLIARRRIALAFCQMTTCQRLITSLSCATRDSSRALPRTFAIRLINQRTGMGRSVNMLLCFRKLKHSRIGC